MYQTTSIHTGSSHGHPGAGTMAATDPFFLTGDELETLTGFKSAGRQVNWLRDKGWRFEVNGNRRPVVARKYAENALGCGVPEEQGFRPNFGALRGR
jgi:hypothetical protein